MRSGTQADEKADKNWAVRERCIEAYEDACAAGLPAIDELPSFVPVNQTSDDSDWIAVELVRVDMERRWTHSNDVSVETYRSVFPFLFEKPQLLEQIEFENKRLSTSRAAQSLDLKGSVARLKTDLERTSATLQRHAHRLPSVGASFEGFDLVQQLGAGAFGQVFLAEQRDLHNRTVVLKVTPKTSIETAALARLQHTNVVPIYSVHQSRDLTAICMPMLGRCTLADMLGQSGETCHKWKSGIDFLSTLRQVAETISTQGTANSSIQSSRDDLFGTPEGAIAEQSNRMDAKLQQMFQRLSFADTVAWISKQIARGLAHAHERGILHLDVKPANILIGDDGVPRLLDFHVAANYSPSQKVRVVAGGTLPYMSAEHLQSFVGVGDVDQRADVFSLGVVMVQMLTGSLPFDFDAQANLELAYTELIRSRQSVPRHLPYHPQASPGLIAIVQKCIAPLPQRYASMEHVVEDLSAHLANRPLKHVREPAVSERIQKFFKRHPVLTSNASLVSVATLLTYLLVLMLWRTVASDSAQRALLAANYLESQLEQSRYDLVSHNLGYEPDRGSDRQQSGSEVAWKKLFSLESNRVPSHSQVERWLNSVPIQSRPLIAASMAEWIDASRLQSTDSNEKSEWDQLQKQLQPKLATILSHEQQQELSARMEMNAALYSRQDMQPLVVDPVKVLARKNPADVGLLLFQASRALGRDDFSEADQLFSQVLLANRHAIDVYHFRGRARWQAGQYDAAIKDFEFVCRRKPQWIPPRLGLILALQSRGKHADAIEQATIGLEYHSHHMQLRLLRCESYFAIGNVEAAMADRAEAVAIEPSNADEWVMRGVARMPTDTAGAKADFESAIALEPGNFAACQNLAGLYSERLSDLDQAIQWMGRAVEAKPNDAETRVSRGVLYARQKKRVEAIADANAALAIGKSALVHYQVACIYSLLNENGVEGIDQIVSALGQAMTIDSNYASISQTDPDMQFAMRDARVQQIVQASLLLQQSIQSAQPPNSAAVVDGTDPAAPPSRFDEPQPSRQEAQP